jgi:telomerase protein component 1
MSEPSSTLRLYLASVPGEMDGERAVIEGLVLPELRARADELGLAVEVVDPAKGKGETGEEWDLVRRFHEIDVCRPFFLALLGERYGDPPLSVPANLVTAHPWLAEDPGCSVLELEILHSALGQLGDAPGSFFYFRDPHFPVTLPERDRSRFLPENDRTAARLAGLKARIRDFGRPLLDGYSAGWSDSLKRASRLDALVRRVLDDLRPALEELGRRTAAKPAPPVPAFPPYDFDPNATIAAPARPIPPEEEE